MQFGRMRICLNLWRQSITYGAVAIFPNRQVISRLRQIPYTTLHQANVSATLVDTKIAAYALNGNLVAAGSAA